MSSQSPSTQLPSNYSSPGYGQSSAQTPLPSIFGRDHRTAHAVPYPEPSSRPWGSTRGSSEHLYGGTTLPPLPQVIEPRPPQLMRSRSHDSFVGLPGFPPAMPSRGPKARFTPDEDALLKRLKEDYTQPKLSWKQIADFFPDRKSGTLQVRYCTRLRRKDDFQWNTELDRELRQAASAVESEKWRLISQKLNGRITPSQCQERLEMLEAEDLKRQDNEAYEIANQ